MVLKTLPIIPFSAFGFSFLSAVVVLDLKFDFESNKQITHAYYITHQTAQMPIPLLIPFIIAIIFIPLALNLLIAKNKGYDLVTLLLNIPTLYIFIVILVPNQEELVKYSYNDPEIIGNYEVNKDWHMFLLPLLLASMVFQVMARASDKA